MKKPQGKEDQVLFKSFVGDILCKVESRLRGDLEKKHGNKTWEINSEIIKEVTKIVDSKNEVSKSLKASGIRGSINGRLATQLLYHKASKGLEPTPSEVERMKKALNEVGYAVSQANKKDALANPNIANHLFDKAFMQSRESGQIELSVAHLKSALRDQVNAQGKAVFEQLQREVSSANQAEVQRRQMDR